MPIRIHEPTIPNQTCIIFGSRILTTIKNCTNDRIQTMKKNCKEQDLSLFQKNHENLRKELITIKRQNLIKRVRERSNSEYYNIASISQMVFLTSSRKLIVKTWTRKLYISTETLSDMFELKGNINLRLTQQVFVGGERFFLTQVFGTSRAPSIRKYIPSISGFDMEVWLQHSMDFLQGELETTEGADGLYHSKGDLTW